MLKENGINLISSEAVSIYCELSRVLIRINKGDRFVIFAESNTKLDNSRSNLVGSFNMKYSEDDWHVLLRVSMDGNLNQDAVLLMYMGSEEKMKDKLKTIAVKLGAIY